MAELGTYDDIGVEILDGFAAVVEIQRPPHNFFDISLINQIADAFETLDERADCRAIVLAAQGKSFCAGANFGGGESANQAAGDTVGDRRSGHLYQQAVRLFQCKKPVIAAVQGAAIGGGLGLAVMPDFRVSCPEARFAANFTRLGFHPGFGLTYTLPNLIGQSKAAMMFYTSRRVKGDEAHAMGLVDVLVPQEEVRDAAIAFAREIGECSPLGLLETRATMRMGMADKVREQTDRELDIQNRLRETEDFQEGVKATSERRVPNFKGR